MVVSSNILTVETTLPTDIGDTTFKKPSDRTVLCIREPLANSVTYNAKEAYAFCYQHKPGEIYLIYCSDADGFASKKEIVRPGIIPNMSGYEGHSYQGCGLVTAAGLMVTRLSRMRLVLASHCLDGHWAACSGQMGTERENQWKVTDVSEEWYHILLNILGPKRFMKYTVYSAFRVDLATDGKSLLTKATMANLPFMAPGFLSQGGVHDPVNGVKMTFSEALIVNK